jgi:isoquinoline 1-oxidoreductase
MLFGKVLRPPSFKAKLVSVKTSDAEALPGVTVVRDDPFIGVTAPTDHAATEALAALQAEWKSPPQPSSKELFEYLKNHPSESRGGFGGSPRNNRGSVADGLKAADKQVKATYTIAYIAHVPLEPRAAVAEWTDG